MRNMRLTAAVAALAIVVAAPAAAPAKPDTTVPSKVKITKLSAKGGSGKVKSKSKKCRKGRKVALKFVGEYGDVRIGTTKTDKTGAWSVKKALTARGIYYATVKTKQVGKTTCESASSKDERL
jgi:hypothetical protein